MVRSVLLAAVLLVSAAQAQVQLPATTQADLAVLQQATQRHPKADELTAATQGRYPTAQVQGRCMVGFLGKVNEAFDPTWSNDAVHIGARIGDVVSFRVDAYQLDAVNEIPGLTYAELAGKAAPTLDKVVKATHADSVHRGINLPQAYTGQDVLIGVLDWGFDYTHPMFYDTLLQETRVRAAWDQFRQAGPGPAAFAYGTELTTIPDLLAAQSDTVNIYGNATHGSHVAGIAGGSGAGTAYRGLAFEAQYVFCTFLVDAAAVLDAFAWMKSIADLDGKRLVINMSWGLYHMGTLDGNSLISQAIDDYSGQGIVFVNSGGNNGDVNFHIKKEFAADTVRSRIQFYPYDAHEHMWGQSISMWGQPGEDFSAGFLVTSNTNVVLQQTPWYNTATQQPYLDSMIVQGNDTVFFNLTAEAAHPLNGRPHFRLRVKSESGAIKIALKATAEDGTVHFWNVTELDNDVGNWGQTFTAPVTGWTVGDKNYGISEPACTQSLITVAAYSAEYTSPNGNPLGGAIAGFSSYGPTLDDRVKPDISAPGTSVGSSISSFTDNDYTLLTSVEFEGRTYPFARFSGTSMASPAVTGIVALLLEADPTLTPAEIKAIIQATARTDQHTGEIPAGGSLRWGMGKINAYQAVVNALGLVGMEEAPDAAHLSAWPNPAADELNLSAPLNGGATRLSISDATGRILLTGTSAGGGALQVDVSTLPAGVYLLRLEQAGEVAVARFVKR